MSKQVVLDFPVEFPEEELENEEAFNRAKESMVLYLFQKGKISSGYAADLLGLCLADFMDLLKESGMYFAHYTKEDLKKDLEAIAQYEKEVSQERKRGV